MKLLIVDNSSENQVRCARRVELLSERDKEMLDLKVKVVNDKEYIDRISEADVLMIGSGLGDHGMEVARRAHAAVPWLHIIMYVSDTAYSDGVFRSVHTMGVRKVLPDGGNAIDLLQELIAIQAEFRKEGRTRDGKLVVIAHAKGGVGATSICGGLSEVCSAYNRKVLLWDLDTASRDLSRSLAVTGVESAVISSWVNGSREITRESLKEALVVISEEASVLMPPDSIAESIDLVCHTDGILISQRIVELTKSLFDVVFVDTGGVMGPAVGSLLRLADVVVVVIDDGILGLTAVDLFLSFVKALVGSVDKIVFVVNSFSGTLLAVPQIASELEPAHHLGAAPWRLPPVPYDQNASSWPGSGRTLYSKGGRQLRESLEDICVGMGLVDQKMVPRREAQEASQGKSQNGLINRLLGKRGSGQGRSA